jgi:Zn-finger nucleic acid-binding protein
MYDLCPNCGYREADDEETGYCSRCAGVMVTESYQDRKVNERRERWLSWLAQRRVG